MRRSVLITCLLGGLLFGLGFTFARVGAPLWERTDAASGTSARADDSRAGLLRRVAKLEEANGQHERRLTALGRAAPDSAVAATAVASASAATPFLRPLQDYPVPDSLRFCNEELPLGQGDIRARFTAEFYRLLTNRHWVLTWMDRSTTVFPVVESRLRAANLPEDLKYVMVIESALDPRAVSPAEAVGYWQFISGTGHRYGLRRDDVVDERRDLLKATDAAIAYLRDLYTEFETWPVALSAYNAGELRIRNAIADQGTSDFYSMVLPRETESYWFRAAAVKLLFEHAAIYDFPVREPAAARSACDTLLLRVEDERLPLRTLAASAGLSYRSLHDLNPQLLRSYLPRGEHRVALPRASVSAVIAFYPRARVVGKGVEPGRPDASVATEPRAGRGSAAEVTGEVKSDALHGSSPSGGHGGSLD